MAKSLTRMIQETQRKYQSRSCSVTYFEPSEYHPKGWWSATATGVQKPCISCESVVGHESPKEALLALCAVLDELLAKQEEPARQAAFQAASAAQLQKAA